MPPSSAILASSASPTSDASGQWAPSLCRALWGESGEAALATRSCGAPFDRAAHCHTESETSGPPAASGARGPRAAVRACGDDRRARVRPRPCGGRGPLRLSLVPDIDRARCRKTAWLGHCRLRRRRRRRRRVTCKQPLCTPQRSGRKHIHSLWRSGRCSHTACSRRCPACCRAQDARSRVWQQHRSACVP